MVAVLPPLLSDRPAEVPRRAGLGDRFHFFRGASGRRYLFSAVRNHEFADFHSAVMIVARRLADGRFAASIVTLIDGEGRPLNDTFMRESTTRDTVIFVHLLAGTDDARRALVADLTAHALPLAA